MKSKMLNAKKYGLKTIPRMSVVRDSVPPNLPTSMVTNSFPPAPSDAHGTGEPTKDQSGTESLPPTVKGNTEHSNSNLALEQSKQAFYSIRLSLDNIEDVTDDFFGIFKKQIDLRKEFKEHLRFFLAKSKNICRL